MQNIRCSHPYSFLFKPVVKYQGRITDGIYKALEYFSFKYPVN